MKEAINLAKYIVTFCNKANCPITNLQLQKILFFIQKDYLNRDEVAFDDAIEAWQFGPVVPSVYYYFCGFGAMPITSVYDNEISEDDRNHIEPIIDSKKELDPWDLVAETHKENGAWDQVFQHGKGNRQIIPNELIKVAG